MKNIMGVMNKVFENKRTEPYYTRIPNSFWSMRFERKTRLVLLYLMRPVDHFEPTLKEVSLETDIPFQRVRDALGDLLRCNVVHLIDPDKKIKLNNLAFNPYTEWVCPSTLPAKPKVKLNEEGEEIPSVLTRRGPNRIAGKLRARLKFEARMPRSKYGVDVEEAVWIYVWFYTLHTHLKWEAQLLFKTFHLIWAKRGTDKRIVEVLDEARRTSAECKELIDTIVHMAEKVKSEPLSVQGMWYEKPEYLFENFKELAKWRKI